MSRNKCILPFAPYFTTFPPVCRSHIKYYSMPCKTCLLYASHRICTLLCCAMLYTRVCPTIRGLQVSCNMPDEEAVSTLGLAVATPQFCTSPLRLDSHSPFSANQIQHFGFLTRHILRLANYQSERLILPRPDPSTLRPPPIPALH